MKKYVVGVLLLAGLAGLLAGCFSGTASTVSEFDAAGKLVKQTVTTESVITSLTQSTRGKTVVLWESGWAAYVSASTGTTDDPTPHGKVFAGKTDRGMIASLPGQQNWAGIAKAIGATKYDLNVSTGGVTSTGTAAK